MKTVIPPACSPVAGLALAKSFPPETASSALVSDIAALPKCNSRLFSSGDTIFTEGSAADRAYV
ncbi:MAG: hypothetical protein WBB18_11430, partial [Nodosilinea sp.]